MGRREHVRTLVLNHGWNATAYQILNPGILHWLTADERAVVGYATAATRPRGPERVWVAAGGPVCEAENTAAVVAGFEERAARSGCRVCWFGADARLRAAIRNRSDYSEMTLGAQPVWDPGRWPSILSEKASLRAQRNRARNKGVSVTTWPAGRAGGHPQLRERLEQWLSKRGLPPLHFLVEPDTLDNLSDRRVFVAEREDQPVAFLVLTPIPARKGWLAEQIIRGAGAPNGTATLLVDAAMRWAAASGSTYLTMGLSPLSFRATRSSFDPGWLRLVLHWLRAHGDRFYNFRGLESFKAKFVPDRWDPITAFTLEPRLTPGTLYAIADVFGGARSPRALVGGALTRAVRDEARGLRQWFTRSGGRRPQGQRWPRRLVAHLRAAGPARGTTRSTE